MKRPLAVRCPHCQGPGCLMGIGLLAVQRIEALTSASNHIPLRYKRVHKLSASERLSLSTLAKVTVR